MLRETMLVETYLIRQLIPMHLLTLVVLSIGCCLQVICTLLMAHITALSCTRLLHS